jgi:hypothetical protein
MSTVDIDIAHPSRSIWTDHLKIGINLLIFLLLIAFLVVFIVVPIHTSEQFRHSNEKIIKLQWQSRGNLARLQHRWQLILERLRQQHEDRRWFEQQNISREDHLEHRRKIEELLREKIQLGEQHHNDEQQQRNAVLLANLAHELVDGISSTADIARLQPKVFLLLRLFDSSLKSSLINLLYQSRLLQANVSSKQAPFELRGANLNDLNLHRTESNDANSK